MHNSWGNYPIFYKTLNLWSILSVCWWTTSRFFLVLVPSWNFVESLVCLEPSSLLGVWHLLFSMYHRISHSSMYLLWISSKWWFIHLASFLHLFFSLSFGNGSWKSWACILTSCSFLGMLSLFDPIYRENSTKSQIGWDVHVIHFHIYVHIFMWSLSYVLLVL